MAACARDERREAVREARNNDGNPFLNGIDFLEVSPADQTILVVHFLQNLPGASASPIPPTSWSSIVLVPSHRLCGRTPLSA